MSELVTKTEFKKIGLTGPAYEVLEMYDDRVVIKVLVTGEIVENYPLADYKADPPA